MDTHVAARLTKLEEVLTQTRAEYQNRERLRSDVASLLQACHTLQPRSGSFSNGGRTVELFYLYGVLPITYKGVEYNVPVTVYFDQPYPKHPPRCFVTPTPGMALRAGHQHVDEGGMIHVPYLTSWKERSSTLTELLAIVTAAFSLAPPVYSTAAARSGGEEWGGRGSRGCSPEPRGQRPRAERGSLSRGRREALLQSAAAALQERWAPALQPAVAELREQLAARRQLQAEEPQGLGDEADLDGLQALECLAEELALDELLVALDELLAARRITTEDFLREVRDASRRQFLCRAQRLKSAAAAAAAAPAPEAADSVRHVPPSGQQALRATGIGASGLADRPCLAGRRL
mmetsp:Transcript_111562/g.360086  ORF Transcript_111562/g.360086 Transcript_111562/m.360086 type:complete len:348 (+) Transcript_111562:44-1087(+)